MGVNYWQVTHREFRCDKCGHVETDNAAGPQTPHIDPTKWLDVTLTMPIGTASPGNPLGQGGGETIRKFVCPGCRGMFEAFFEVDWKAVTSYGDATQVLPTSSVQRAVMAAGLGPSVRSPMAQALAEARALAPGAFPNPTHKVVVK